MLESERFILLPYHIVFVKLIGLSELNLTFSSGEGGPRSQEDFLDHLEVNFEDWLRPLWEATEFTDTILSAEISPFYPAIRIRSPVRLNIEVVNVSSDLRISTLDGKAIP